MFTKTMLIDPTRWSLDKNVFKQISTWHVMWNVTREDTPTSEIMFASVYNQETFLLCLQPSRETLDLDPDWALNFLTEAFRDSDLRHTTIHGGGELYPALEKLYQNKQLELGQTLRANRIVRVELTCLPPTNLPHP